jgi:hypothetical protein
MRNILTTARREKILSREILAALIGALVLIIFVIIAWSVSRNVEQREADKNMQELFRDFIKYGHVIWQDGTKNWSVPIYSFNFLMEKYSANSIEKIIEEGKHHGKT